MLANLLGKNYVRRKLLDKSTSPEMEQYFKVPFPEKKELIADIEIVSIDFETTGLDKVKDSVISLGLVNIKGLSIELGSAKHKLINADKKLSETSVVIHQITDSQLIDAEDINDVLPFLLNRLKGKVLLAHNAKVEIGFIKKMCKEIYGSDFLIPVIDTQYLAKRSFDRKNISYKNSDLRLFNLRSSFNMPAYKAHNALMDAIATAELFLALVNQISPNKNAKLGEFMC